MSLHYLESCSLPALNVYRRVPDADLRNRGKQGVFIAESDKVIHRALDASVEIQSLFLEEKWINKTRSVFERLNHLERDIPVYVATREQFREVTGYEVTRGALAVFERPAPLRAQDILIGARRVAILEDITNYTNIGAVFRSAAALGIDAVLITHSCHDPLYRRAARVSMGTVFQVPWARIGAEQDWASEGVPLLRSMGFTTVALALSDDALPLDDPSLKSCEKLALVLGTEGDGLASSTIAQCDHVATIPMAHGVDSLNVAAASAVAFWEMRLPAR